MERRSPTASTSAAEAVQFFAGIPRVYVAHGCTVTPDRGQSLLAVD